jgi:hypothetical protein
VTLNSVELPKLLLEVSIAKVVFLFSRTLIAANAAA